MHVFTFLLFFAVTSVTAKPEKDPDADVKMYFRMVRVRVLAVLLDRKLPTYAHAYTHKIGNYECSWILFFQRITSNTQADSDNDGLITKKELNTAVGAALQMFGNSLKRSW